MWWPDLRQVLRSYGFISEVCLEFLEDPAFGISEVFSGCFWEEFLECGYGVWPLGMCCPCQPS